MTHLPEPVQLKPARPHRVHDAGVVYHPDGDASFPGPQLEVRVRRGAVSGYRKRV